MTLYIEIDGELFEIITELEDYNFNKSFARDYLSGTVADFLLNRATSNDSDEDTTV